MGHAVLAGDPPLEIVLRQSARARRISLRVSSLDGRVTLSLPRGIDPAEALAFAEQKSDWIRRHLAKQNPAKDITVGGKILLRGQKVALQTAAVRRAQMVDGTLLVPDRPAMVPARVKAYLKLAARGDLTAASLRYSAQLGRGFGRITLRDTRSRWGSCSSKGDLMYSWRLIMAPPEVLDYVAAHEVSHLVEMNHSGAFWDVVARICPDYPAPRQWLRENGHTLHQFRFGD